MLDLDIPSILLDPQNEQEVINQAYERIRSASANKINDFSPSSPVAALIEGQAFVYMELLWFLNQLPEALALEVLKLSGVSRSPGHKSAGRVNFLLQTARPSDFVVEAGYLIAYKESAFQTTATLVIPAGSIEASVPVEAVTEGSEMDVPAFGLATSSSGLSFVQSIYNTEPITGGANVEPLVLTIQRAQKALRSRNVLVTAEDYETAVQDELGYGSQGTAIPMLTSDRSTTKVGHVHVFVAGIDGLPAGAETCANLQAKLRNRSFAGSAVWVSPIERKLITIDAIVNVQQLSQGLANAVFDNLQDYLNPVNFSLGSSIRLRELEYRVRSVPGVDEVVSLLIDSEAVNTAMPNLYTQPVIETLALTMLDTTGLSHTYYIGTEDDLNGDN